MSGNGKSRIDRQDYFMKIAILTKSRSTCKHNFGGVGCVIVEDFKYIVSTGYNGSPPSDEHCIEAGCLLHDGHCIRTIHAEANAIARLSTKPNSVYTVYTTLQPCLDCFKLIWASGIKCVIYSKPYDDKRRDVFINDVCKLGKYFVDPPEMSQYTIEKN